MAWLYLRRMPVDQALVRVREGIQHYNNVAGKGTGYHETVTVAYVRIIAARIERTPEAASWDAFAALNPDLFDRANPPTLKHYRRETIVSERARAEFVAPDLAPLPGSQ